MVRLLKEDERKTESIIHNNMYEYIILSFLPFLPFFLKYFIVVIEMSIYL